MNTAWIIAQHLHQKAAARGDTHICCGHIITRITKNMGMFNFEEMSLFDDHVVPVSVDMRSFRRIRDAKIGKLKNLPYVLEVEPLSRGSR